MVRLYIPFFGFIKNFKDEGIENTEEKFEPSRRIVVG